MFEFGGYSPILTVVVPCFNEEAVLSESTKRLSNMLEELINEYLISQESKILYVDDGSKDQTWKLIEEQSRLNGFVKGLKLAKNVGHQNALLAGLDTASERSDCVISIDADLQDDIGVMKEFIEKFHSGCDVVYGVRNDRNTDSVFKKYSAQWYYRLMKTMGVNLVYNHADYRLLSHRVLVHLKKFNETNMFLRGVIPLIGYKSAEVYYKRQERFAGESKYPLKKMLAFAIEGITSFSITPIRMVFFFGSAFILLSLIMSVYVLVQKILGQTVSGWSSIMLSIWFIGGIQLMGLGLIGEYIGKIYKEVKQRPKYLVEVDQFSPLSKVVEREKDEMKILN